MSLTLGSVQHPYPSPGNIVFSTATFQTLSVCKEYHGCWPCVALFEEETSKMAQDFKVAQNSTLRRELV